MFIQANYGRKDTECVQNVKAVYKELELEGIYHQYEDDSYKQLITLIDETSGSIPKEIFTDFANKIFKREK